jgi:hypothetical protein
VHSARFAAAAAALGGLLLVAGCGSSTSSTSSAGAKIIPADADVVVTLNTDTESDQWRAATALIAKFPGGGDLIQQFFAELEGENLTADDLKAALGPETDFVVSIPTLDDASFVVLTQPDDPDAFKKIVTEGEDPGVVADIGDGWWAASDEQAALDAFTKASEDGDKLADSDAYGDATEKLPEDALLTVYYDTAFASELTEQQSGTAVPFDQAALTKCFTGGEEAPKAGALAVQAEDNGLRLVAPGDLSLLNIDSSDLEPITMDEFFPSGALLFFDVQGVGQSVNKSFACIADSSPEMSQGMAQIQLLLGTDVEELLGTLLGGELGAAVYGPGGLPGAASADPVVVAASEVSDPTVAIRLLTSTIGRIALFTDGEVGIEPASAGGRQAQAVTNKGKPVLYFGAVDGKLVVSNTLDGLAAVGAGASLAEDSGYTGALEAAGVSDESYSVMYANLASTIGLFGLLADEEAAPEVLANLKPLKSAVLWSNADDELFQGFVEID